VFISSWAIYRRQFHPLKPTPRTQKILLVTSVEAQ
jgi:hypothetical protein